jgi:two-component system chemotaxis response regulator CheB
VRVDEAAADGALSRPAADPFIAARRIQDAVPDVILPDLEMPRMDGLTFLRRIMAQWPIPAIVCSALTEAGSRTLFDVHAGAVDVVSKPRIDTRQFLIESSVRVCGAVGAAAGLSGVIVQHMRERFTSAFARRLDGLCTIARKEVPLVSRHRPSVDVLFRAAARCAGADALGSLMTGMGDDGANGLLEMRRAGALTVAQDEESCVVFGMPRAVIERGAAMKVLPLNRMHHEIIRFGAISGERRMRPRMPVPAGCA